MREGKIIQLATPSELYTKPADPFVAHFFGDLNEFEGVCDNGQVATPFGPLNTPSLPHGSPVNILVRHEGVLLGEKVNGTGVEASVLKSRMLGRTSLVDFKIPNGLSDDLHVKARLESAVIPEAGKKIVLELDQRLAFVFSALPIE